MADRCSHRGCSLHEGKLEGDQIVCPCHGTRFGLDGSLAAGPAAYPQPALETRVQEGKIEVRRR
jgi:nitrite reductase/ring-hydroxylating ferredoxin subunit